MFSTETKKFESLGHALAAMGLSALGRIYFSFSRKAQNTLNVQYYGQSRSNTLKLQKKVGSKPLTFVISD